MQLAQRYPQVRFVWFDIENASVAAVLDDWDVDTFPTIVAGVGAQCLFKGAVLPSIDILERMLQNWLQESQVLQSATQTQGDDLEILALLLSAVG